MTSTDDIEMDPNPPPTPLSSKTKSKLRRERSRRRASQYAQETGTHEEILHAYLRKNKIAGAIPHDSTSHHEQTAQTIEHPAPHSGNPPATPHTTDRGVKRTLYVDAFYNHLPPPLLF